MFKKIFCSVVTIVMTILTAALVTGCGGGKVDENKPIKWENAILERNMRFRLGFLTGDIRPVDLQEIEDLDFDFGNGDDDINDLKYFTNAKTFSSDNKNIEDISVLGTLPKLEEISFSGCEKLSDISPLAKLENLKVLTLDNTAVKDLSSLKKLKNFNHLKIENEENFDISSISKMNFESITFEECENIKNFSELTKLPSSTKIVFNYCESLSAANLKELLKSATPKHKVDIYLDGYSDSISQFLIIVSKNKKEYNPDNFTINKVNYSPNGYVGGNILTIKGSSNKDIE